MTDANKANEEIIFCSRMGTSFNPAVVKLRNSSSMEMQNSSKSPKFKRKADKHCSGMTFN